MRWLNKFSVICFICGPFYQRPKWNELRNIRQFKAILSWTMQKMLFHELIAVIISFVCSDVELHKPRSRHSESSMWFFPLNLHLTSRFFCPFFVSPSQVNWTRLQMLALWIPEMVIFKTKYQANKRQQISLSLFLSDYFSLRLTTSNRKFQLFPPPPEKKNTNKILR